MAALQEYEDVKYKYHGYEEWWLTEEDVEKLLSGESIKKGWLNMCIGNHGYIDFRGDKSYSEKFMILHVKALDLEDRKLRCDAKDPVIVFHQSDKYNHD